ncbi:chaperone protein dnaJ 11, chloroplastic [Malania oleifera]|uniref:chaperone protein dnaJ 11, chloroplastic n=1 Tax=Malania oleifera TaxID=397392 RepID=UPI0025AEA96F|nr:chaperone protein dnaJ 11, chloroplastic [Malania oleifera]
MLAASPSPSILRLSPQISGAKISARPSPPVPTTIRFRPPVAAAAAAERTTSSSCFCPPKLASSCSSLYEILGLPMGATGQEIKAAYRRLARICHPDVAAVGRKDSSANEFLKIHTAYSTLSDPEKRADYDRELFRQHRPFGSFAGISASPVTVSSFSGYPRRNWETDQCW